MIRLALDSNVWISAFLTPGGFCERVARARKRESVELITSKFILREVEEALSGKLELPGPMVEERVKYMILHCLLVGPTRPIHASKTREADNHILECAVAGRASYLLTGDKEHLLPLGRFEGVEIVTPRRMVELLQL